GDDRLRTEVEGYGDMEMLIDAGLGDDAVAAHGQANSPLEFVRDPRSAGMVIDLGDGANQLLVETACFAEVAQDFRSGSGNDQIIVSDRAGPFFQFESK